MPPSYSCLKAKGLSDARIKELYDQEREDDIKIQKYLDSHPNAKMLDILELLDEGA